MKKFYVLLISSLMLISLQLNAQFQQNYMYFFSPGNHKLGHYQVLASQSISLTSREQDSITPVSMDINHVNDTLYAIDATGNVYTVNTSNLWTKITQINITGEEFVSISFDLSGTCFLLTYDGAMGKYTLYKTLDFSRLTKLFSFTRIQRIRSIAVDTTGIIYALGMDDGKGWLFRLDTASQTVIKLKDADDFGFATDGAIEPMTNQYIFVDVDYKFYFLNLSTYNYRKFLSVGMTSNTYNCVAIMPVDVTTLTIKSYDSGMNPLPKVKVHAQSNFYILDDTTNQNGVLTATVPQTEFDIWGQKQGYFHAYANISLTHPATVNLQLSKKNLVTFTVKDTLGNTIQNLTFSVYNPNTHHTTSYTTNNQGQVTDTFPNGIYEIRVRQTGYASYNQYVNIHSDTNITILLVPKPVIHLTVKDQSGNPLSSVEVQYQIGYSINTVWTNAQGKVDLTVDPGYVKLTIQKDNFATQFLYLQCTKDTNLTVTMSPGYLLSITTYKPDGMTLLNTMLWINDTLFYESGRSTHNIYLAQGTYKVKIYAKGYLPIEMNVDLSSDQYYTFSLQPAMGINVSCYYKYSYDKEPADDARIYLDNKYVSTGFYERIETTFDTHTISVAVDGDSTSTEISPTGDQIDYTLKFYLYVLSPSYIQVLSNNNKPISGVDIYLDGEENMDFHFTSGTNGLVQANTYLGFYYYTAMYNGITITGDLQLLKEGDTATIYLPLTISLTRDVDKQIMLYPNPAVDFINLTGLDQGIAQIIDINGRLVKQIKIQDSHTQISLHELKPGIYSMRLTSPSRSHTLRFIKQ